MAKQKKLTRAEKVAAGQTRPKQTAYEKRKYLRRTGQSIWHVDATEPEAAKYSSNHNRNGGWNDDT